MSIRMVEFSKELRTTLAALDLARETGRMPVADVEREIAAAIQAERAARNLPEADGWRLPPSPYELHNPHGRQSVFWQEQAAE